MSVFGSAASTRIAARSPLGDAEVEHLHDARAELVVGEEDVARLHVAMDDADRVRARDADARLRDDAQRELGAERADPANEVLQVLAA